MVMVYIKKIMEMEYMMDNFKIIKKMVKVYKL